MTTSRTSGASDPGAAEVRFSPEALDRLPDLAHPDVVRAAKDGTVEADGWVRAVVPIESLTHAESEMLRLGAEVEVLDPPELRETVAATCRRILERYDEDPAAA